jgi:hypothetical protein
MLESVSEKVGLPALVALVFGGSVLLLLSATLGGRLGQLLAVFIGLLVIVGGLFMVVVLLIDRMNADIGQNRQDLKEDLDEILEESDAEE